MHWKLKVEIDESYNCQKYVTWDLSQNEFVILLDDYFCGSTITHTIDTIMTSRMTIVPVDGPE